MKYNSPFLLALLIAGLLSPMKYARVVYLGRNQEKLDAALAKCRVITPDAQCLGLVTDVLDRTALKRARDEVLKTWGRIDGLLTGTVVGVDGGFTIFSGV